MTPHPVLIIPDKFKGTLAASEAADALAAGWRQVRPGDSIELLPMSDGGDGFGEVMGRLMGGERRELEGLNAAHEPCRGHWWQSGGTGVLESAAFNGLAMLPRGKHHPFDLDTSGVGLALRKMRESGAEACLVGVGGSATNDGGFGAARALGWRFLNGAGDEIQRWPELKNLQHLERPAHVTWPRVRVAADVTNPLLGSTGASRIYGPQKGLRPEDFPLAEACLGRLAEVVQSDLGVDAANLPGAGAAGGLGYGLQVFFGGTLERGFDLFSQYARLKEKLGRSQLVITGEGQLDGSSLMGKGVGRVLDLCRETGVLCAGVAGRVEPAARSPDWAALVGLTEITSVEQACAEPATWVQEAARRLALQLGPRIES
jgi:glycerate kinase